MVSARTGEGRLYRIISLFMAVLPLAAGAELLLEPTADLTPPSRITVAQEQADLQALFEAARDGYAGPELGLAGFPLKDETPLEFCLRLQAAFQRRNDAHLNARLLDRNCAEPVDGRVGDNVARERWSAQVIDGVTVLGLPTFPMRDDQHWGGFLDVVRQAKASGKDFVLDLRGNGGGDDAFGYALAQVLYGLNVDEPVPTPVVERALLQTPAAFGVMANAIAYQEIRLRARGAPVPPYYENWRQRYLKRRDLALVGFYPRWRTEAVRSGVAREAFAGKLYVLMDRRCGSSCENTLQFLEALPGRVLVGENSMGAVTYGEVGKIILPNAKIAVSLSTTITRFRDRRAPERLGYAPDLKSDGDALATALAQIKADLPPAPSDTADPAAAKP